SGAMRTTFERLASIAAYLPRSARIPAKSSGRYSGRRSSSSSEKPFFFIDPSFLRRRFAGADQADCVAAIRMGDHEQPATRGHRKCDEAFFVGGMIRVRKYLR